MDDPELDPRLHQLALRGLRRLNCVSRSSAIMWNALRPFLDPNRPTRVLDVATGSGDLPLSLWQRAQRANLPVEIVACDISETALSTARQQATRCGAPVKFVQLDALGGSLPPDFDVICCSLFFHHLTNEQTIKLLRSMAASSSHVIVNDLVRSAFNTIAVSIAAHLITQSSVVHIDAYRSMLAAYTPQEVRNLCEQAGINNERLIIKRAFPCRMIITWSRES